MAYSYTAFTGNGSTTQYAVAFAYIRREHVAVTVAGVPATFTWVNNSLIQMDAAPANGAAVRVYRTTPISAPLVDFADGATLVAADLDTNSRQSIYIQQELDDAQTDNLPNVIPNGNKGDITTSVGGTVWAINTGAVTEAKLAANAVTSGKIADGTIDNADVNASAGIVASKLAFTQAGTGATARTIDSKLKDVVSVKDFGAGQGGANDAVLIQAAIDAVSAAGGGTVYFPAGTYNLQAQLIFPSNVNYKGEGKQSLLKVNAASFFYIFNQASVNVSNVVFDSIGFDGSLNYPADSTVYKQSYALGNIAIRVGGVKATNIRIQDCWFNQFAGGAIDINGMESSHIAIVDNYFYKGSYKQNVINIRLPSDTYTDAQRVSNVRVTGNHIEICGPQYHYDPSKEDWTASADAISFDSAKDCVISDNIINLSGACGIRVEESIRVTVANNKIIKPGQEGITFYKNCYDCSCVGNTIQAWGRTPLAYAIRNYSGTYVVAREFPRAAGPTLPANPTVSSWFEVWPYTLTNINTANIVAYSSSNYYTGTPSVGILPFRGYSAISVTNESEKISVIGNNCLGDLTTSSGKYVYASDFGFTPVHSANDATAVSGRNCLISGNGFTDSRVYRIYHPQYHDLINLRGLLGDAVYAANRDSSSLIFGTNPRLSQGGELIATTRSNFIANEVNFPATQVASSNANTLDDYEEGVHFPTMTATTGSITLSNNRLSYTKIGRAVSVQGEIDIASVSSPTGDILLTLPFQNAPSTAARLSLTAFIVIAYGFSGSPSGFVRATIGSSSSTMNLGLVNDFTFPGIASNLQAGSTFTFNFTYTASA
jgi:parallel beta-helix repeat protein